MEHLRPADEGIIVVDYGSQYTLLITRRLREIGVYSEMVGSNEGLQKTLKPMELYFLVDQILLTTSMPGKSPWVLEMNIPILGVHTCSLLLKNLVVS